MQIDSKPVVELGSVLAAPPAELAAHCDDPVAVPDAAIAAGATERLWAQDRASLVTCGGRHSGLAQFYAKRDAGLAGK